MVYPRYQANLRTSVADTPHNALRAVLDAWNRLSEDVYSYERAIYSLKLMVNF